MNLRWWGSVATVIALALTGCASGQATDASVPGAVDESATVRIAWLTPPQTLDPHRECHIGCRPYWLPVFETLYDFEADATIEPLAAADLPEYSADGLEVTIPLREGRTFHDGSPIDAAAVKASLERGKTVPQSTAAPALSIVSAVEVVDPLTVKIVLSRPRPFFEAVLAGNAGALISPKALESGADVGSGSVDAGSGPYRPVSLTPNEGAVYSAVADYFVPERGRVATLEIQGIPDVNTGLNGLQSGQFDLAYGNVMPPERISQLERAGFVVRTGDSLNTHAVLLRISSGELADVRVRQAMMQAIDRKLISDTLYDGKCEPATQMFSPRTGLHVPGYDPYPYDPDAARRLLAEAGHADGIELPVVTVVGNPGSEQNAAVLQEMLGEVGIDVVLTPMTSVDGVAAFNRGDIPARSSVVTFSEDSLATIEYSYMPGGVIELAVPDEAGLVALYDELVSTTDTGRQQELLRDMGREVTDKVFALPICYQTHNWAGAENVVGMDTMGYRGVFDPRELAIGAD